MKPSNEMIKRFEGSTVILTGAASGIGRALVLLLSRCGATIHALDRNEEGLAGLLEENDGSGSIHTNTVDVSDFESYSKAVETIFGVSGSVDFLFNNAGVTMLGEAYEMPFERWKWLLDINLMGTVNGTRLIYPKMIDQGYGHIVCTASIAGATGYATAAAYTASKAGGLEFARSLRAEAKHRGVTVSVACPGYVDSAIFSQDRIIGVEREAMIRDLPVRMMSTETAAWHYLRGVAKRKKTIVFPFSAKFLWHLSNWAPFAMTPFHKKFLRAFQEKQ